MADEEAGVAASRPEPSPERPRGDSAGVTVLLIALGVAGISFSAPIVVDLTIPALAVAFWRNAFGAVVSVAFVGVRGRAEMGRLLRTDRRPLGVAMLAGVALAVHFALWIPSLRMTSVAASTALVTLTPAWTVVSDRLRRRAVARGVVVGVALALAGTLVVTGVDAGRSPRAFAGDILALLGGMAAAAYMSAGEAARRRLSTSAYTAVAYTTCSVVLLVVCLVGRQRVAGHGYTRHEWLLLVVLTLCAQLVGHTLLNRALAVAGATTVTLAILLETPGAALVAWVWLGQQPPVAVIPGAVLVLAGIALVVLTRRVTNVTVTEAPPPG